MTKKITIDELAIMMQREFNSLHGQYDHLDKKIDNVHQNLDKKIDNVYQKLDTKIDNVYQKLDAKIDSGIASVRTDIRRLESSIDDIKERLKRLEKRSFEDEEVLAKEVVDLRKRVDFLEKEFKRLKNQPA
jgi:predicted  nucleic acid-binding Zn-ribbon protein